MARRRRTTRNNRGNGVVSVAGINFLVKHVGGLVLRQSGAGQPLYEIQAGNYGQAGTALYANAKELGLTDAVIDGLKIGLIRKLGLSASIMKIGKTTLKSV
jgi:hypothetical protein